VHVICLCTPCTVRPGSRLGTGARGLEGEPLTDVIILIAVADDGARAITDVWDGAQSPQYAPKRGKEQRKG
jgi:hypothetical protein